MMNTVSVKMGYALILGYSIALSIYITMLAHK